MRVAKAEIRQARNTQENLRIISSDIAAPNMSIIDYNNPFPRAFASLLQLAQG